MGNNSTMLHPVPDPSNHTATELLIGYPNKVTDGLFGPEILVLVFGGAFLGFLSMRYGPMVAFLLAGFISWITSLALVAFGSMFGVKLVGSSAVVVTSVVLMLGLVGNYMSGGRR